MILNPVDCALAGIFQLRSYHSSPKQTMRLYSSRCKCESARTVNLCDYCVWVATGSFWVLDPACATGSSARPADYIRTTCALHATANEGANARHCLQTIATAATLSSRSEKQRLGENLACFITPFVTCHTAHNHQGLLCSMLHYFELLFIARYIWCHIAPSSCYIAVSHVMLPVAAAAKQHVT